MDASRDVIADYSVNANRSFSYTRATLEQAGGLPAVVVPLGEGDKPVVEIGRGCATMDDFARALNWAYHSSPTRRVKIIPAALTAPPS